MVQYLTEANEVVLDFPYKDCVLEGGQTKGDQKRQEIFWNETLASDEIDRLLEPKVLINWKRYNKDGQHAVKSVSLDDNLIIKGNNLIALHSLKKVYKGKVKLIYIDPPYNTGNDSFNYNDRFNHSTWLTFMKNRLEVARELLSDDGVIFVQCDDNEHAYLKVLMDGVFGRENFVGTLIWKGRISLQYSSEIISTQTEFIITYSKSKKNTKFNKIFEKEDLKIYNNPDNDPNGNWTSSGLIREDGRKKYKIITPSGKVYFEAWLYTEENMKILDEEKLLWFGVNGDAKPRKKSYEKDYKGRVQTNLFLDVGTSEEGTNENKKLFENKNFNNPKPEKLLQRIIEISTQEGDLVLDYHLGSGTTCAVAHKMGRRYIGIEQMDYVEDIVVERLKKVIAGEQGGISKSVDWQGGGG